MKMLQKTIGAIVDENYIYARALHVLGISFYENEHKTLEEACKNRHIDRSQLIRSMYLADSSKRFSFSEIRKFPLHLTISYLKFAHQQYIKVQLPYVAGLIASLPDSLVATHDLREVFPLFVEDFIKHIHEEEDQLFEYVSLLQSINQGRIANPLAALWKYRDFSLEQLLSHHVDDDEMAGIRELIEAIPNTNRHIQVIKKELEAFDREILYHAEIENDIFFPKAIGLEGKVFDKLSKISREN